MLQHIQHSDAPYSLDSSAAGSRQQAMGDSRSTAPSLNLVQAMNTAIAFAAGGAVVGVFAAGETAGIVAAVAGAALGFYLGGFKQS